MDLIMVLGFAILLAARSALLVGQMFTPDNRYVIQYARAGRNTTSQEMKILCVESVILILLWTFHYTAAACLFMGFVFVGVLSLIWDKWLKNW